MIFIGMYVILYRSSASYSLADSKVEASAALTPGPQRSVCRSCCLDSEYYVSCVVNADNMMTPDAIQGDTVT